MCSIYPKHDGTRDFYNCYIGVLFSLLSYVSLSESYWAIVVDHNAQFLFIPSALKHRWPEEIKATKNCKYVFNNLNN